jgi:hypothetical protein
MEARFDLGAPAGSEALTALARVSGVTEVAPSAEGASARVSDRDVLPRAVGALVAAGVAVYEVASRPPSLEDVYFAIEARILAEHGGSATDGFLGPRVAESPEVSEMAR